MIRKKTDPGTWSREAKWPAVGLNGQGKESKKGRVVIRDTALGHLSGDSMISPLQPVITG